MTVEDFVRHEDAGTKQEPDLVSQLSPLLRARSDLDDDDVEMLEEIIQATYKRVLGSKASA